MKTSGTAAVNETHLWYEVAGRGQPLALIHGGGGGRKVWDRRLATFAERYQVVCYDCRGYGVSGRVVAPFSAAPGRLARFLSH